MANNKVKKRLFCLAKLLFTQTDEECPMSTQEILDYLDKQGLPADRKTLRSDLALLLDFDFDIITIKGSPNKYFWGERIFQVPEMKLLIGAVSSSRFITDKKTKVLTEKIAGFAGKSTKNELIRHIPQIHRVKTTNENIYYIVDSISDAINGGQQIAFYYYEFNEKKEKVLKNNGELYVLSPYALYWNDDFYYVVGFSEKRNTVVSFRVDRIVQNRILDDKAVPMPKDFNLEDYACSIFEMFTGEIVVVDLECENNLMKYVIDRFGEDVETEIYSANTFIAHVPVCLSPTFYGWVFQFKGKIQIMKPESAAYEFDQMIECQYKKIKL